MRLPHDRNNKHILILHLSPGDIRKQEWRQYTLIHALNNVFKLVFGYETFIVLQNFYKRYFYILDIIFC